MFDIGYWVRRLLHRYWKKRFLPSLHVCVTCGDHVQGNHFVKQPRHVVRTFGAKIRGRRQDPRDYDIRQILRVAEEPPESFDCREIGNVTDVLDQGSEGSCVGQSGAGVKNGMEKANGTHPDGGISARCCYNGAKWVGGYLDGEGAYSDDLMKFMLHYGPCRESLWPYRAGYESNVYPPPTKDAQDDQPNWKIGSWYRINKSGISRTEVIRLLKLAISQRRHGIYLAVPWPQNWMYPVGGTLPNPSGAVAGGHAIHLIAYDPDGFTLRNSWGTIWGDWGDAWASWSSFDYFERNGGYDLLDAEDEVSPEPEPPEPEPTSCEDKYVECITAALAESDFWRMLTAAITCVVNYWICAFGLRAFRATIEKKKTTQKMMLTAGGIKFRVTVTLSEPKKK